MSYINMDHAGWVERNIAASKKQKATARDRRNAAEHKGWHAAPDELNPFQRRAFPQKGTTWKARPMAPSLDRIDNKCGYETANVRLVCVCVNVAINEWGVDNFRRICRSFVEMERVRSHDPPPTPDASR